MCEVDGKPSALTFAYLPSNDLNPLQPVPGKAEIIVNNGLDDDGTAYVVVSDNSSDPLSGDVFFQGSVNVNETFTASTATAGSSFSSNTYIYFFGNQGGPLLQQVKYHTSCSAPIVLGAQVLSGTLVAYVGSNGVEVGMPTSGLGDPADTPTGPTVLVGDEVVFNYELTNTGNVALTNVQVSDDVLGTITEFVDKGNGDGLLDPGETWVLTASTIATTPGQQMNVGTVTANSVQDPNGAQLTASDPGHHFVETLKFFVVDKDDKATYAYTDGGSSLGSTSLVNDNNDARGATSNPDGDTLWVVDKDKHVYIYETDGDFVGAWKGKNVSDKVQGIATDGNDIWIVEEDKDVLFFSGGASFVSGEITETSRFQLEGSDVKKPSGITTDGTSLWIVDEDKDAVYKYTTGGSFIASWSLDNDNSKAKGITINPADPTDMTIWVVDQDKDQVFAYANGKSNGGGSLSGTFALDPESDKPEGIADPPVALTTTSSYAMVSAKLNESTDQLVVGARPDLTPVGDANRDDFFNRLDILQVLQSGKYKTDQQADWSEGDWNGDGRFDRHNLIEALQTGDYDQHRDGDELSQTDAAFAELGFGRDELGYSG